MKIKILIDILQHFYASNNIAETLHSKLNIYLPTNRLINNNFIISVRNVLINYEIKKVILQEKII